MSLYAGGCGHKGRRSEGPRRQSAPDIRTLEYPSWSSQIRRPGSTVFQKGVGNDEQLSHDGCECNLCSHSVGTDLQLIDGTRGINSIFSARQPPEKGAIPAPLFPDRLPEGAAYDALLGRVMGNEIIRGKLLSNDGELTLVVLALGPSAVKSDRLLGKIEAEARKIAVSRGTTAVQRMCNLVTSVKKAHCKQYMFDRKLHELIEAAMIEIWTIMREHNHRLRGMLKQIIASGMAAGEFYPGDTALAARLVNTACLRFCHPRLMAEYEQEPEPALDRMLDFCQAALVRAPV